MCIFLYHIFHKYIFVYMYINDFKNVNLGFVYICNRSFIKNKLLTIFAKKSSIISLFFCYRKASKSTTLNIVHLKSLYKIDHKILRLSLPFLNRSFELIIKEKV